MRAYIGFDDTDMPDSRQGTGKLARRFEEVLPDGCRVWGVVRQQLLLHQEIPYTSHNSSACVVIECPDNLVGEELIIKAIAHIEEHSSEGSDPGLCVIFENNTSLSQLIQLGLDCTRRVVTQRETLDAIREGHLSGHGGTNDGIIGAAAAVGLTLRGWSGRFIEFGKLRNFPETVAVSALIRSGIQVISLDRDCRVPGPDDSVQTKGWLRPRLWDAKAVLPVIPIGENQWESLGEKNRK